MDDRQVVHHLQNPAYRATRPTVDPSSRSDRRVSAGQRHIVAKIIWGLDRSGQDALAADTLSNEVFEAAAETLLQRDEGIAPRVLRLLEHVSVGSARRIEEALREAGHDELLADHRGKHRKSLASLVAWAAEHDADAPARLLEHLAASPPAELAPAQSSDLGELADLYHRLDLSSIGGWPRKSDDTGWWFAFVDAVVRLGGFDKPVISAQARLMQARVEAFGDDAFYALGIAARHRPLDRWSDIQEPESVVEVLRTGLYKGLSTAHVAAAALSRAPAELVVAPLTTAVEQLAGHRRHQRLPAVALAVVQRGAPLETWASDERVVVHRLVAAESLPAETDGRLNPLLAALAFDVDRQVAREAVLNLSLAGVQASEELATLLRRLIETGRVEWDCTHCGTRNSATATSCSQCSIVPPDPVAAATEALANLPAAAR